MSTERYGSWTREGKSMRYFRSWRPGRSVLVLAGLVLILLSAGLVFLDVRKAGDEAGASPPPKREGTMRLSIPSMRRVDHVPVYTSAAHNKPALHDGTLHLEGTGFPWQREANVYIAGHRLGYPNTESWLTFWDLSNVVGGDKIYVTDANGTEYTYNVFKTFVVSPSDTHVTDTLPGKNILTLQSCTLPDYGERLIVQAELTETSEKAA